MNKENSFLQMVKSNRQASTVFFGFLVVSMIVIAMFYLANIYTTNKLQDDWNYILSAYERGIAESKDMNSEFIREMEHKIQETYGPDKEQLGYDLENLEEINDLTKILDSCVRDKYLMGIQNDNNDPFIMDREKIIIDTSSNCAIPGEEGLSSVRTFSEEVYNAGGVGHYNPVIAVKALNSMASGENKTVIWSFLPVDETLPWAEEVKELEYVDITVLKELFFKYNGDIRVLYSFEFVTPHYIYRHEDLAGNRTVNELRAPNAENYQLIVVQGFNIVDVIDVIGYRSILDSTYSEVDSFLTNIKLVTVLILAIMFSLFFRISKEYNREISEKK